MGFFFFLEREREREKEGFSCSPSMAGQQPQEHQISFHMVQPSSSMHGSFMNNESGAYDYGELDQALYMFLEGQDSSSAQQRQTLNIFPSQPMHVDPSSIKNSVYLQGGISLASSSNSAPKRSEQTMELGNPRPDQPALPQPGKDIKATVKKEVNKKNATSTSEHDGPKTPDPKTLRRLAQNREAARKSRLRKKAYVQQLESSRIRLAHIEQELQRARTQGVFFDGGALHGEQGLPPGIGLSSAMFDMEYARWLEKHHRLMCELRAAVEEHLPENELRMFVDSCLEHCDEMMNLKSIIVKADVFHLISGMWMTPIERCFMWIGGCRPSELIKIVLRHIEPLTEQQIFGICALQQSTHETEEALSQEFDALHHSLSAIIVSDALSCPSNMANYMGQMAVAMNKLSTLEAFVRQADNLRQQTLHRLHQSLTTRQTAWCFLAIADYFHRLRALSSLWLARPRQE